MKNKDDEIKKHLQKIEKLKNQLKLKQVKKKEYEKRLYKQFCRKICSKIRKKYDKLLETEDDIFYVLGFGVDKILDEIIGENK